MGRFKGFIGLACCIGLLGLGSGVSQSAEITLRYAGTKPIDHHITKSQYVLAKLIGERTGGRVEVLVYPAGQLFSDKETTKAVQTGAVDMVEITSGLGTGLAPGLMIGDFPFFFVDRYHSRRVVDGPAGEIVSKQLERVGIKTLYWMEYGQVDLLVKKPVKNQADLKGQRIRGYGEVVMESLRALGAAPSAVGAGEVYLALQRGTIDGLVSGVTSFWDRKHYEVAKYITYMKYVFTVNIALINQKKLNSLPPDIQKIIMACSKEVQGWGRNEAEKEDIRCLEKLKENGVETYVLPDEERERWRKISNPVVESLFLKRNGEEGKLLLELVEKARQTR